VYRVKWRSRQSGREEVERDLQVLGVKRWRELVIDRTKWRDMFDRPKPTAGCSANGRRRRIFSNLYMFLATMCPSSGETTVFM